MSSEVFHVWLDNYPGGSRIIVDCDLATMRRGIDLGLPASGTEAGAADVDGWLKLFASVRQERGRRPAKPKVTAEATEAARPERAKGFFRV